MPLSARLDPESFAGDEVVGIAVAERDLPTADVPEADWTFVPRRLFARLLDLGRAYSLHFASLLDARADSELSSVQCQGFLEELRFLEHVVADPALSSMLEKLVPGVVEVVRYSGMSLRVSPPRAR